MAAQVKFLPGCTDNQPELSGAFSTLIGWADERRRMGIRANARRLMHAHHANLAPKAGLSRPSTCSLMLTASSHARDDHGLGYRRP